MGPATGLNVERTKFRSTLLPNAKTGNSVVKNGNNVEATFDIVERIVKNRTTCSIRQYCFDIVAGVDGA